MSDEFKKAAHKAFGGYCDCVPSQPCYWGGGACADYKKRKLETRRIARKKLKRADAQADAQRRADAYTVKARVPRVRGASE